MLSTNPQFVDWSAAIIEFEFYEFFPSYAAAVKNSEFCKVISAIV